MRRSQFLVVLGMALVLPALALLLVACHSSKASGPSESETLAATAVLAQDDMPGFTGGGDTGPCEVPSRIEPLGESSGALSPRDVLACAMSSYVTNEAYSGEGRAQIDAQTRADGYDPEALHAPGETPQPFTPIHGAFVSTHHGIFELYVPVTVLTSPDVAHDFFLHEADNARTWELGATEIASNMGDESVTVKRSFGPDPTIFQTSFETVFRRGRVVVVLNTMGSPDLSVEENWRIANLMDGRIRSGGSLHDVFPTFTPLPTIDPCPLDMRAISGNGFLVRLPSSTTALTPVIKAPFLVGPNAALDALGLDRLFVSDSDKEDALPARAEVMGPFYATAADPELHSCWADLSDRPAAASMRDWAFQYLLEHKLLSFAELSDPAVNLDWQISDDILPDGLIAVYAVISRGTPIPQMAHEEPKAYMAVFQGKGGAILGAAEVNLYAGDSPPF